MTSEEYVRIRELKRELKHTAAAIVEVAIQRRVDCLPRIAKLVDAYLSVKAQLDAAMKEGAK